MRQMRRVGVGLGAVLAIAVLAGPAQAATPAWQCGASAVWASVAGNPVVNPVTTSTDPCVSNTTGVNNIADPAGLPTGLLSTGTAVATTSATPTGALPAYQTIHAIGRVENLALTLPAVSPAVALGVRAARANASAVCTNGKPALTGSSDVAGLTLAGQELPVEQVVQQLSVLLAPLGQVVDLDLNEQIRNGSSLTQRALHLRILTALGTPVLDVVVGEASVASTGTICDPAGQTGGRGTVGGAPGTGGSGSGAGGGSGSGANGGLGVLRNGVNGSTCARVTMRFVRNRKTAFTSRYGTRAVVRGRVVNCKGKAIVRARIDVVHVLNGKKRLVKTGLRSRAGGALTLILPMNVKTRDIRFEYRGNLRSSKVTSRSTLKLTVRNRAGRLLR